MPCTGLPGLEMKRHEIEHVLRAAAAISQESSFVVVGAELDLYPSTAVVSNWARRRAAEAQS